MKKIYTLLALAIIVIAGAANAQAPIVVQSGSNTRFFQSIPTAVSAANIGDTIYIPGGSWDIGAPLTISKTLHFIGTGHNPDSAKTSGICYLTGDIRLSKGASNGSLTGIQLSGTLYADGSSDAIVNYSLTRNRIDGGASFASNFSYSIVAENIINQSIDVSGTANGFYNNIFSASFSCETSGNNFKNNLFLKVAYFSACRLENNIFLQLLGANYGFSNNILNNNLIVPDISFPYGTNIGTNNIVNQIQSSIFVNQSGNTFNYAHNYHLQATSPGKNAGTDGTDIGIYGGLFPWKDGSIPLNPQIKYKKIGDNTDPNGNLQINIKVSAQDH